MFLIAEENIDNVQFVLCGHFLKITRPVLPGVHWLSYMIAGQHDSVVVN